MRIRPLVLIAGAALGAWFLSGVARQLPASDEIGSLGDMANATVIYDAFDQPVFTLFREQRLSVSLQEISPNLTRAVVAVEDQRFYDHRGFDLIRIVGAAVTNVMAGRLAQGGSTITQQLARASLLSRKRTFRRKVAEVVTAIRIEQAYAKEDILELYLNKVYFGAGFYGAEAAALGYFGKRTSDVTLGEAALLAGLIQAPSRYAPIDHPDRARARREVVLTAMLETGAAASEEIERARQEPLRLQNGLSTPPDFGGYFRDEVRRRLVDRFGADAVYREGLHVYTTLVPELQRAAESAVAKGLGRIETLPRFPHTRSDSPGNDSTTAADPLQAALIAIEPRTGAVQAVVGGRQFTDSPFNRATRAERQPGSAFKPFVYAAALESGLRPTTWLEDLDRAVETPQGAWLPDDEAEGGAMMARTALRLSSNRAAVRLLELTGVERIVEYAERFALGPQPPVPSLALGSGTVTLDRLTAAYSSFVNDGRVPDPTYIRRVETSDRTVVFDRPEPSVSGKPAIGRPTAFIVANLLRDVVDAGTGARVRREGFVKPAGGKTGTTDQYRDAWFVGFTPALAAGVWIGFDRPRTIMPSGYASDLAAPVWADFMKVAATNHPGGWIEPPPGVVGVEVCALSGALARSGCRQTSPLALAETRARRATYVEYFIEGTEPLEGCALHRGRNPLRAFARLFGRDDSEADRQDSEWTERPTARSTSADFTRRSIPVVHDHVFGSCRGRLVAGADSLRYETTHRDAFTIEYSDLERFEYDHTKGSLRLKPRGGRRYNFTSATGASLSAFYATAIETRSERAVTAP